MRDRDRNTEEIRKTPVTSMIGTGMEGSKTENDGRTRYGLRKNAFHFESLPDWAMMMMTRMRMLLLRLLLLLILMLMDDDDGDNDDDDDDGDDDGAANDAGCERIMMGDDDT